MDRRRAAGVMVAATAAVALLASCTRPGPATGTVEGQVTSGPTCPVETIPPKPQCADRPVTDAAVEAVSTTSKAGTVTDDEGRYSLVLPAGVAFTITVGAGRVLPRCPPVTVTVAAKETVTQDISCDSGIR
jgi:hypothetical protein